MNLVLINNKAGAEIKANKIRKVNNKAQSNGHFSMKAHPVLQVVFKENSNSSKLI